MRVIRESRSDRDMQVSRSSNRIVETRERSTQGSRVPIERKRLPARFSIVTAAPLALLGVLFSAHGSAAELMAQLDSDTSYGEAVSLRVQVLDTTEPSDTPSDFELAPVDGLRIEGPVFESRGSSAQLVQERSGFRQRVTHSAVFRYDLIPTRPNGEFTIGPVVWKKDTKSNTVVLRVERKAGLPPRFDVEPGTRTPRWKHGFRVVYRMSFPRALAPREGALRELSLPILSLENATVRAVAAFPGERAQSIRVGTGQAELQSRVETAEDGTTLETYHLGFEVTPLSTGRLEIPAAAAVVELRTGEKKRMRDFFGNIRLVEGSRPFRIYTTPLEVDVQPLPSENVPPAFTGAVGRFTIEVSTQDQHVKAFDPIRLVVRIRGEGVIRDLALPEWHAIAELSRDFDFSTDVDAGEVQGNAKVFEHVIRARRPGISSIPALPFSYFDPDQNKYLTTQSNEIPIVVEEGRNVGIEETTVKTSAENVERRTPTTIVETRGVAASYRSPGTSHGVAGATSVVAGLPFLLTCAIPPTLFASIGIALLAARRSPADRARASAGAKARIGWSKSGEDSEAKSIVLANYFRDRLGLPPGEVTPVQIEQALEAHGVAVELRAEARVALERLQASRFAGLGREGVATRDLRALVERIEKATAGKYRSESTR
jgi:hypothetical protein